MLAQLEQKRTLEEYFRLEQDSEEKFEYWDRNVWTVSGASISHNTIVANVVGEMRAAFRSNNCRVFPSNARVYVPTYPPYRYPDASVLCGEIEVKTIGEQEMLVNPQLIIEILSDSTEAFDRGDKFSYYKSISSFSEYLLISQKRAHVTQFVKQSETVWEQTEFNDLEDRVELQFVECSLAMTEIYRDVTFENDSRLRIVERND